MAKRIVTANYSNCKLSKTPPVFQYNYGQLLELNGFENFLPKTFEVHFSNDKQFGKSITMIGNDCMVDIPDQFLQTGREIWAWLYLHDTEVDGETVYTIQIPVIRRAQITNEEPTPVQQDAITQAIAALNAAATAARKAADEAEAVYNAFIELLESGDMILDDGDTSDLPDETEDEGGET